MEISDTKTTINFWLLAIFFAIIFGGVSLGILYTIRANSIVKAKITENKEAARPANMDAIIINDQNCKECFDVTQVFTNLEKANVNVVSRRVIDRTGEEAKALIEKYAIEKLPTVILRGEIQKNANLIALLSRAGSVSGDVFVLRQIGGPYVVATTGEIKGQTELTLISDSSCGKCYDAQQHEAILFQFGLSPKIKAIDINSLEARSLINKYRISMIPTFVLTGEVNEYPALLKIWPQVGIVKKNAYIFTLGVPSMGVYKDLKTGKIIDPSESARQSNATTSRQ